MEDHGDSLLPPTGPGEWSDTLGDLIQEAAQRLDIYRSAMTVAQLDGFRTEVRSYGGTKRGTVWKSGDADFDFRHGIMDLVGSDGTRYTRAEWSDDVASRIRRGLPTTDSPARVLDMDETGAARRAARSEHEGKEVVKYDYEQVRITRKHGRQVSTVTRKRRIATPAKGMELDLGSLDKALFEKVKSWVNSSSVASCTHLTALRLVCLKFPRG